MGRILSEEDKKEIFHEVQDFFAEEFEVEPDEIKKESNIIEDFGGDSILFLELMEELKEKFEIDLEVRVIGQYMLDKPTDTVGETLEVLYEIIEKGEDILKELEE